MFTLQPHCFSSQAYFCKLVKLMSGNCFYLFQNSSDIKYKRCGKVSLSIRKHRHRYLLQVSLMDELGNRDEKDQTY